MRSVLKKLVLPIIVSAQTIILYLLIIIPAEYLLTEKYLIFKHIKPHTKTYILLSIFLLVFLLNFLFKKLAKISKKYWPVLLAALVALLFTNRAYTSFYNDLQKQPKIYSLSSDWSIVAMRIEIDGKNFGPAWQKGQVFVDDFKLRTETENWSEERIIAVQPVPNKYFQGEIYVENHFENTSNKLSFRVRDPGELHLRH